MPRRKASKRTAKRTTAAPMNMQKIEKDFMQTPSKLASQLGKQVNAHQKQELKLKKALAKGTSQIKSGESKLKALGKNKTSAGKKQFKVAKKFHTELSKNQNNVSKELKETTGALNSLNIRYTRLLALDKYLSQFDKQWNKENKQNKLAKKAKATKKKQVSKAKNVEESFQEPQPYQETSHSINSDEAFNVEEAAEVTN